MAKRIKNINEAYELAKKYRALGRHFSKPSLSKIRISDTFARDLTGFSQTENCTLCVSTIIRGSNKYDCERCIYRVISRLYGCFHGEASETYDAISDAKTYGALSKAYIARANYISNLLINNY